MNCHDYLVVTGALPTLDGRIPMPDGAGVVEAVGDGVAELKVGDSAVSCFFPGRLEGEPRAADLSGVPGDGIDGYALEGVESCVRHIDSPMRPAATATPRSLP